MLSCTSRLLLRQRYLNERIGASTSILLTVALFYLLLLYTRYNQSPWATRPIRYACLNRYLPRPLLSAISELLRPSNEGAPTLIFSDVSRENSDGDKLSVNATDVPTSHRHRQILRPPVTPCRDPTLARYLAVDVPSTSYGLIVPLVRYTGPSLDIFLGRLRPGS